MSTNDPFATPSPTPAPVQGAPKRSRLRRFAFASALLVTGGVIGAVIAGPVRGQGWYGPMHHGFGPGQHEMMGGGFGGDRMFFPGRIERGVERLGWITDASTEQKQKINAITQKAADDIFELRNKHLEARKQVIALLAAPAIDRPKLEALRADQMKLAEAATKRVTDAVADIAEVLTPAQRADLANRLERWQRWRRG
jgi:Spy/CpxP family protein refolding chaperone